MAKGKLIIIEAGDGSGKATQTRKLAEHLIADGKNVVQVSFPDYKSRAAEPLKMYLEGEYGDRAGAVNAFAASTFFAVDRFASFNLKWKADYENGAIILADRYTTSNMVHQAVKLTDQQERSEFLDWLWDFEFNRLGLPVPDAVIFLDMDPMVSDRLIAERAAHNADRKKDIHEKDVEYLHRCHDTYMELADKYSWHKVKCSEGDEPRSIDAIHAEVYRIVEEIVEKK